MTRRISQSVIPKLYLSVVFVDTLDGRAIHPVNSMDWRLDVQAEAKALSNPTISYYSKIQPAPRGIAVITPVSMTFFGHVIETSKQLPLSIIRRPYFPKVRVVSDTRW